MLIALIALIIVVYVVLAFKMPKTTLLSSFPAAAGLIVLADTDPAAVIMSMCLVPVVIIVLVTRGNHTGAGWLAMMLRFIFKALVAIPLTVAAIFLWPLALLLLPVFITIVLGYVLVARNSNALYVFSTIGSSMRQNLPLSMALETSAGTNTDKRSQILRGIAKYLSYGHTLSDAIKQGFPKCPAQALGMIRAAEKVNQLPQAIQSIESDMVQKADESKQLKPADLTYPFVVLSCALAVTLGLSIFIVPTFAQVLHDSTDGKIPFPASTRFLLDIANFLTSGNYFGIGIAVALIAGTIGYTTFVKFQPRRSEKLRLPSRLGDFTKWHFPFTHWFEMNYSLLQAVSLMRVSLNAGCPVNEAIRNTLALDTNHFFKKRLKCWLAKVEAGDNISLAASKCGMGPTIAWAFDDKVNQGNTPQILKMLEEFYRSNYNFRINIAKSIFEPFMVLCLGAVVGFIIFAMFMPMFTILQVYTAGVTP